MANEPVLTVVGNLTADPELRHTQNGLAVANFTVAQTPRNFDRDDNEWVDGEAVFMRVSAWRDLGEHVAESLRKGDRVIVQGRLAQKSYETKEGDKRSSLELTADAVGVELTYAIAEPEKKKSNRNQSENRRRDRDDDDDRGSRGRGRSSSRRDDDDDDRGSRGRSRSSRSSRGRRDDDDGDRGQGDDRGAPSSSESSDGEQWAEKGPDDPNDLWNTPSAADSYTDETPF